MTTNSSVLECLRLQNERNDVRIYATDEETLNEETALKIECNYENDFHWVKSRLPEEFLGKRHLSIFIDRYYFDSNELVCTYSIELLKKGNKKYVGTESFDLNNQDIAYCRPFLYKDVVNWAEGQKLDVKIKKIRKPAYKSPSKYFSKNQNYVRAVLGNKKRAQLTDDERTIVKHLFYVHSFKPKWFFETSDINRELQLSGQMFDKIIESLIEKKLLEKDSYGSGYSLYLTV